MFDRLAFDQEVGHANLVEARAAGTTHRGTWRPWLPLNRRGTVYDHGVVRVTWVDGRRDDLGLGSVIRREVQPDV